MATENKGKCISLKAAADFSAKQYYFAVATNAGDTAAVAAEGVPVLGVIQDNPSVIGAACDIMVNGVSKVKVGANAVAAGALVKSDASGLADTAGTGDDGVGMALTGGAAGVIIEVCLDVKSGLRA